MNAFETKEEITKAVESVMALFDRLDRGDILRHSTIKRVLNIEPHTQWWGHVMLKARRRLERERGISTWPEHGIGYKLLTIEEQLDIPRRRTKRSIRQARKAIRSIEALPSDSLSPREARLRMFLAENLAGTEDRLRCDLRSQVQESRTLRMPLRPANPA